MTEPMRDDALDKTPVSFIILIVLAVLYLGWRLVQGVMAVVGWIA